MQIVHRSRVLRRADLQALIGTECLASEVPDCLSVLKVTLYGDHPLKDRGSAAMHIRVANLLSTTERSQQALGVQALGE